jgi:hypothetical protein
MSGTTKESHFPAALMLFFTKSQQPNQHGTALSSNIPSLPSLLGMNYETMIMLFHFAGFAGPGGKVFLTEKFNTFISRNNLGQVLECAHYRLKSSKGYYICIGN